MPSAARMRNTGRPATRPRSPFPARSHGSANRSPIRAASRIICAHSTTATCTTWPPSRTPMLTVSLSSSRSRSRPGLGPLDEQLELPAALRPEGQAQGNKPESGRARRSAGPPGRAGSGRPNSWAARRPGDVGQRDALVLLLENIQYVAHTLDSSDRVDRALRLALAASWLVVRLSPPGPRASDRPLLRPDLTYRLLVRGFRTLKHQVRLML